ncbi:uncharacterized protein [Cicer arietinum]|uniref:Uncharacterized protein LOC101509328 n=1 Tax=Cicer arietinum TaxID=3827 RepID=A0A1S2YIN8_CICAR|nr:uncharacterized protein LOC101509328 [Cicer arietinum]
MANSVVKVEPVVDEPISTTSAKGFEDTEVDIVSWTNKVDTAANKNEDPDATEYSSSFADTSSDAENSSRLSDVEVESKLLGKNGLPCPFDAFGIGPEFRTRKRKVTDHWRNYIRPLMWRCKWTEIRLKQIESQALKYRKELAKYDKGKHTAPDCLTLEEFGSKSLPFSSHQYRHKAKMRRKRKKVENTTDIASYTSHHHLFSYLENKKSDPDGSLDDDLENQEADDDDDKFGVGDDPPNLVVTPADVTYDLLLWKIDHLHSRVRKLKSGVDAVMSKNASKFSSPEKFCLVRRGDAQTSSAQSPTNSAENEYTASVGAMYNPTQHEAEFDFGDFLPDSAVSSFGEVAMIPDIIESTESLLVAANATLQLPLVGDSHEHMVDNVLKHEVAETEDNTFKSETHIPIEKLLEVKTEVEEGLHSVSIPVLDSNVATATGVSQEHSALMTCANKDVNFSITKRKRGERKPGSGGWSKKSPGEPENQ